MSGMWKCLNISFLWFLHLILLLRKETFAKQPDVSVRQTKNGSVKGAVDRVSGADEHGVFCGFSSNKNDHFSFLEEHFAEIQSPCGVLWSLFSTYP